MMSTKKSVEFFGGFFSQNGRALYDGLFAATVLPFLAVMR
jgi:hypothetical protein